ncbi:MAG: TIR domain-containing protein [Leptolyngbya sp. SIO4C1]|nr:TIR domain-containing protein [Leptolyngbya sp. SIO4C1]
MTQDELLALIDGAARDGRKELDLSKCRLTRLPPEIGQLQSLQQLDLRYNQLSALPPEIVQLQSLQRLDLRYNQLSALPPEIVQLQSLQRLDLSSNQLSALPPEIVQLQSLQLLNLSANQLSALPPEIVQLQSLQQLYLSANQLSALPPEIVQLQSLQQLYLSANQLSALPPEIVQLQSLQQLYLSANQLSALPPEIVQLQSLQQLYLSANQLSALPPEIVQLQSLQWLNLSANQLSALPPEIVQLQSLQRLDLRYNQLSALPPEIVQLQSLQQLYLRNNKFTSIPSCLQNLDRLERLDLQGNPLPIPPEILSSRQPKEIFDFYFSLCNDEASDPLYEAKLLIVGEGGAGKTSLAKKIDSEDYKLAQDEASTEGIDVIRWEFYLSDDITFRVNIWDFGGQEIYHATHQFFLTERSLYLLVADTRQENTDFYYWLKAIELLSDSSPVLIVKNEKQDRQCPINERQLRGEFTNLKESLATNLADNRGLSAIKGAIQHHISKLSHVGTPLPGRWVRVRNALENYAQSCDYISVEEYFELCRLSGFTDEDRMLQVSRYLHDLGVCLHFQTDRLLKRTVILKPEWGTNAVYKVLDNAEVRHNLGRFSDDDLENIWSDSQYKNMQPELLKLMMQFELCYEIPGRNGHYIAPQLLQKEQLDYEDAWSNADCLILRYHYEFKPKAIFPRLIVAMHEQIEQQQLVWKHGVILTNGWARAEVIEEDRYYKSEIRIRALGSQKKRLLFVIAHELEKINATYEKLQYDTLIPCNCETCKGSQTPTVYPLEKLQRFLRDRQYEIFCDKSYKMVQVRRLIDNVIEPQAQEIKAGAESFFTFQQNPFLMGNLPLPFSLPTQQYQEPASEFPSNSVFVSYAWGGDSESIVDRLEAVFADKEISLIRDKRDLGFKGSIKAFMQQLGKGQCVVVVLSKKYLESENCMFELLQIAENEQFRDRIFPIVLNDAKIYKPIDRIKYVKYWESQIKELDDAIKEVSAANMDGFREDIDLYNEIRRHLPSLTNILKDMNTLTAEIHTDSGFNQLIQAIERKVSDRT